MGDGSLLAIMRRFCVTWKSGDRNKRILCGRDTKEATLGASLFLRYGLKLVGQSQTHPELVGVGQRFTRAGDVQRTARVVEMREAHVTVRMQRAGDPLRASWIVPNSIENYRIREWSANGQLLPVALILSACHIFWCQNSTRQIPPFLGKRVEKPVWVILLAQ